MCCVVKADLLCMFLQYSMYAHICINTCMMMESVKDFKYRSKIFLRDSSVDVQEAVPLSPPITLSCQKPLKCNAFIQNQNYSLLDSCVCVVCVQNAPRECVYQK